MRKIRNIINRMIKYFFSRRNKSRQMRENIDLNDGYWRAMSIIGEEIDIRQPNRNEWAYTQEYNFVIQQYDPIVFEHVITETQNWVSVSMSYTYNVQTPEKVNWKQEGF